MKIKTTLLLSVLAVAGAVSSQAQNATLPSTEAETQAIISAKGQLTNAPTVYVWMLDAQTNKKGTKPQEYTAESGDKNDTYYMLKLEGGTDYDTPVSNNIIAADPTLTDRAVLRPNYARYETKSDEYRLARIKVVDATGSMKVRDELTTIRGRGNSTWYCDKKSYRLKFSSKTKLLAKGDGTNNYADAKNWTLLANAGDKTMLRNALTREVGLRLEAMTGVKGLPYYPAYQFVDLVVNNVYMGTYQISDHTQIQKGRIDIDSDNGWFLEGVVGDAFLEEPNVTIGSGTTYNVNVKNPEDDFYTAEVEQAIIDYLGAAYDCMQEWGTNAKDFTQTTGLFKYVDMESLVAYFIGNEITGNYDGLISNYMYRDINPDDKLMFGPLWDYDIAYGNYGDLAEAFIFKEGKNSPMKSCIERLVTYSPEFVDLLVTRWEQVYDNGTLITYLQGKVDEIAATMAQTRTLNYTPVANGGAGWTLSDDMLGWGVKTYSDYDSATEDVKSFIATHVAFLDEAIHALKANMTADTYTLDAEKQFNSWDNPDYFLGDYFGKICDVQVTNRTFKGGEWNTICLPFSLSEEELQATFGTDVQLREYSSITGTTMRFTPAERLLAGMPYLIRFTGSDIVNPSFSQVSISCKKGQSVRYAENADYAFTGIYFKTAVSTDGTTLLLSAADEAFNANSTATALTGLSAYITCPSDQGTMPIVAPTLVVYDAGGNAEILTANQGQTTDVTLDGRTLYKDGSWNTLCLPFNVTVAGSVLDGAEVRSLTEATLSDQTLYLTFTPTNVIEAGKPCIIKWATADDLVNPTFENVTISTTEPATETVLDGQLSFAGTFEPVHLTANQSTFYLGSNNTLYYPDAAVTLNAFRAYFLSETLTFGNTSSAVNRFVLRGDDTATGIGEQREYTVLPLDGQGTWYTIDGRQLTGQPQQKGIYIRNGKKMVVK